MRMRQKVCGKRYYIYARRNKNERWTDWTQVNDLPRARYHIANIINCGYLAKLIDKETGAEVICHGSEAVS